MLFLLAATLVAQAHVHGPAAGVPMEQLPHTLDKVAAFDQALTEAGVRHEFHSYDADHAFANPSSGRGNPEAAKDAWEKTLKFLSANLR
jgi:carboxymethylenebutenolidase